MEAPGTEAIKKHAKGVEKAAVRRKVTKQETRNTVGEGGPGGQEAGGKWVFKKGFQRNFWQRSKSRGAAGGSGLAEKDGERVA